MINGWRFIGPWRVDALLFLVPDAAVPLAVTDPEPGAAVPVEVPPAFWEPAPVRPTPVPAPFFMYADAADGMAGRESPVTAQLADLAGQLEAPPVELYPPSPDGLAVLEKALFNAVKSAFVVVVEPEMVTRPYLLPSSEYS